MPKYCFPRYSVPRERIGWANGVTYYRGDGTVAFAYSTRSGGSAAQCGVLTRCRGFSGPQLQFNQRVPQLCYSSVFLDGVLMADPQRVDAKNPPPDLAAMEVSDLTGIEFYPGSASLPLEFVTNNDCGTLLIWTRER